MINRRTLLASIGLALPLAVATAATALADPASPIAPAPMPKKPVHTIHHAAPRHVAAKTAVHKPMAKPHIVKTQAVKHPKPKSPSISPS